MPFQLNSKNILLTYAQCEAEKDDLLTFLRNLCPTATGITVGRELHEDGHPHLHAFVQLPEPLRTRDERFFDFNGFHPNIQGARSPQRAADYVRKDGDVTTYGTFSFDKRKWADVLTASTAEEAENIIKEVSPRDYVLQHDRVISYIGKKFRSEKTEYVPDPNNAPFRIDAYPELQQWIDQLEGKPALQGGRPPLHPPHHRLTGFCLFIASVRHSVD